MRLPGAAAAGRLRTSSIVIALLAAVVLFGIPLATDRDRKSVV